MPQTPALVLSLLIATTYAVAFCIWQGRRLRDVPILWLAAVIGFAIGQVAGSLLDLVPWTLGEIRIVEATLGTILFLFLAKWLGMGTKKP